MSEKPANVVRAVLGAQKRRDWSAMRRLYDPDIEWEDVSGLWGGDWGGRRGFDDLMDAFVTWFKAFEHVQFDLVNTVEVDDDVLAFIQVRARGRKSGVPVDRVIPTVWIVRSGRAVRVKAYQDDRDALEALGLRE